MRAAKPVVALATVVLMTLTACDGGSGSDPVEPQTVGGAGAVTSAKDQSAEGPVAVPEAAQAGGTLTVDTVQMPTTFDPTQAYFFDSISILKDLVTRSLTQQTYVDGEMVLVPDLATDLGRPNADSTRWTFTLKEGLKYEDGSAVKPEDVAYAVRRSFASAELPEGPTYQTTFFLDGDKYEGPYKDGGDYRGVVVRGNDIIIKMRRPFADMDYYASFPAFTAIPEGEDDPASYGRHPLATGPYKFEDYKPGSSLTLVRNEHWDPDTDPGRIQMVDRWRFNFGRSQTDLESGIVEDEGSAQTRLTYDNVAAPTYRAIRQEDGDRLVTGTSPCTYMLYLDMRKIEELPVRQAIGWAYPYEGSWRAGGEIVDVTRQAGTSILPPGTAGRVVYDPLGEGHGGDTTDPDKAKELLSQAGYEPGEYDLSFYFSSDVKASVDAKDVIVDGLEAGGFRVRAIPSTSQSIRADEANYDAPVNLRGSGWCSDWPTGGSWFPAQWDGELVGLDGMPNVANLQVPELDDEQDRILDELGREEAAEAWGRLDRKMMTEYYPAVNLGYSGTAMIRGSKVGGMENNNVYGMPTFSRMFVAD